MSESIENRAFAGFDDNMTEKNTLYTGDNSGGLFFILYYIYKRVKKNCHIVMERTKALIFNGLRGVNVEKKLS